MSFESWGLPMNAEYRADDAIDLAPGADKGVPDEFFDLMSQLLREPDGFAAHEAPTDEVLWAIEEDGHCAGPAGEIAGVLARPS